MLRRLADFVAALLCIWAGLGHTPAGALLRTITAKITGTHTAARPLFAYFSGTYLLSLLALQLLVPRLEREQRNETRPPA